MVRFLYAEFLNEAQCCYADYFVLSVAFKPIMQSSVMLSVVCAECCYFYQSAESFYREVSLWNVSIKHIMQSTVMLSVNCAQC
jgi:hypothetical protein